MQEIYTLENTLNEVLGSAGDAMSMFFHSSLLQFVPESLRDIPLREVKEQLFMPWGPPFPADDLVKDANDVKNGDALWELIPLWVTEEAFYPGTGSFENVSLMRLKSCEKLLAEGRGDAAGGPGNRDAIRPCVIICPGGGYENLAFRGEGIVIAERYAAAGIRPFILNYRFSPNRYPAAQTDLMLAILHLRANADVYHIDPDNLAIIGFSAGGHLCASTAALRDEIREILMRELGERRPELEAAYADISGRPDKVVLSYPVISFGDEDHEPSFLALTGGDERLREHLSVEKQVDADYPVTFVWTNADDSLVPPSNTTRMGAALEAKGVLHLMRVYPQGEHGCNLGVGTSCEGWFDEMLDFLYR